MTRAELQRRKQQRLDEETRAVMATRAGRAHAWRVLTQAGLQSASFVPGDPHATSYAEGRRSFALTLAAEYQRVCPADYATMMREALETAELERLELARAEEDAPDVDA